MMEKFSIKIVLRRKKYKNQVSLHFKTLLQQTMKSKMEFDERKRDTTRLYKR